MKMRKKKQHMSYYNRPNDKVPNFEGRFFDTIGLLNTAPHMALVAGCGNTILAGWVMKTAAVTRGELRSSDLYRTQRRVM